MPRPPSPATLQAFGAAGNPVRLAGGRGRAFRGGDRVLKPVDNADVARAVAEVMAAGGEGRFPCGASRGHS